MLAIFREEIRVYTNMMSVLTLQKSILYSTVLNIKYLKNTPVNK